MLYKHVKQITFTRGIFEIVEISDSIKPVAPQRV